MSQQSFISWIRQPASIVLIIALVIMFVMLVDQSKQQNKTLTSNASESSIDRPPLKAPKAVDNLPGDMPAPSAQPVGGELPKIVQRLGGSSQMTTSPAPESQAGSRLAAPDLGSLLGGMEEKVKAEPNNVSNRLLLAQTYNELGLTDKALAEARSAIKQFPDHSRAKLVFASILSNRSNENELKEAVDVLKNLQGNNEVKQYLVDMYLGNAWIRLGDHQSAKSSWQTALKNMPVADNRRSDIEKSITNLNAGN